MVAGPRTQKPETKTSKQTHHMKKQTTSKALLAGAAIAGLLVAGIPAVTHAASPTKSTTTAAGLLAKEKGETHDCAGKNSCKSKGGCKTGDNGCAGKNSCKGKGGCATKDGKPVKGSVA
jgi:hypothetical protein